MLVERAALEALDFFAVLGDFAFVVAVFVDAAVGFLAVDRADLTVSVFALVVLAAVFATAAGAEALSAFFTGVFSAVLAFDFAVEELAAFLDGAAAFFLESSVDSLMACVTF